MAGCAAAVIAVIGAPITAAAERAPIRAPAAVASLPSVPAVGAIPRAFIRNQFQNCDAICPYIAQGLVEVPVALWHAPGVYADRSARGWSVPMSAGAAAFSVTRPANAAMTGIISNDLSLVLPRAQNALVVAVVEGLEIASVLRAGPRSSDDGDHRDRITEAVATGRTRVLDALNRPLTPDPASTAVVRTPAQQRALDTIDAGSAILFQAPEMLLLGATDAADSAARNLTATGDPAGARAAGEARFRATADRAAELVRGALS
ncbi:hypothetical protein [Gordonia insulae]|uniref:hypothetical protein n=1 Tax=Gordonia insulae TaxID=2420509 RepID=UPI001E53B8EE|nr:hypothetical protein [Gordonia insulae]